MTDVLFYHLQGARLDAVLPMLLEKTLERGWRAVVEAGSPERVAAIDALLWTYRDDAFLPHGTRGEAEADQPILVMDGPGAPNGATVRFLVDGAEPGDLDGLERAVLIFDGADPDAVAAARAMWSRVKAAGHQPTYWQQDEDGRWVKRA